MAITFRFRYLTQAIQHKLFNISFVDIAPLPVFSGFKGLNDRVVRLLKVLSGMLVFGAVAAADVSTVFANAQVHPAIAHVQAFFAALSARGHFFDLIGVSAL